MGTNASTFKGVRLDRGLCSVEWLELFPGSKITHLPTLSSNHTPILLSLVNSKKDTSKGSRFRFQAAWTTHANFPKIMVDAWKEGDSIQENQCYKRCPYYLEQR